MSVLHIFFDLIWGLVCIWGRTDVCRIVSVNMNLRGYPDISISLSCQPITASDESWLSWFCRRCPIDVLLGCNYYWELVTNKIICSREGPIAIWTKLGWVLCGPTQSSKPMVHSYIATTRTAKRKTWWTASASGGGKDPLWWFHQHCQLTRWPL